MESRATDDAKNKASDEEQYRNMIAEMEIAGGGRVVDH